MGMAQTLLTKIGHNIGLIIHQRQRRRAGRGIKPGAQLQVADRTIRRRKPSSSRGSAPPHPARYGIFAASRCGALPLAALDAQVMDVRLNRAHGLLAALPWYGPYPDPPARRSVTCSASGSGQRSLCRYARSARRFSGWPGGGDLRIQLFIGQACLLKRDLRRFHFIAKRRVIQLKQQVAPLHGCCCVRARPTHTRRRAEKPASPRA